MYSYQYSVRNTDLAPLGNESRPLMCYVSRSTNNRWQRRIVLSKWNKVLVFILFMVSNRKYFIIKIRFSIEKNNNWYNQHFEYLLFIHKSNYRFTYLYNQYNLLSIQLYNHDIYFILHVIHLIHLYQVISADHV